MNPKVREYMVLGLGVFVAVAPGVAVFPHYVGNPASPTDITLVQIAFVPVYIAISLFFKSRLPQSAFPALLRFSALSAATSLISWGALVLTRDALPWPVPNVVAGMFDFQGANAVQAQRFELWCEYWIVIFLVLYTVIWAGRVLTRSTPDPDRQ